MENPNYSIRQFGPNEILFQEGEKSIHFYMIKSGKIGIFKHNKEGGAIPLAVVGPGESLGELAMLDRSPRSAMAITLTDVEALVVTEEGAENLVAEIPEWAKSLMVLLVNRLRRMNNILVKNGIYDSESESEVESARAEAETTIAGLVIDELSIRKVPK